MDEALREHWVVAEPGGTPESARISPQVEQQRISDAVKRDYAGLRNFIRKRVSDTHDAEDILQDVFSELIEAYRMMRPVEQVTAWLFRVARNRIIDLFRRRQREQQNPAAQLTEEGMELRLEEMLPSTEAGPEALYMRNALLDEIDEALDELPEEQREVFVAHELMGYSFNEISQQTGVAVNTLLSRKHYAVGYLRQRLRAIYDEFVKG